jgi:hypothetical protein
VKALRWAALSTVLLPALLASACETTERQSARLAHAGASIAAARTSGAGAQNRSVGVGAVALLDGQGRSAAVVELINNSAATQRDVPLRIDVIDGRGRSLYRNNLQGIEPSLQQLALLPARARAWWVDDQVLAPPGRHAVRVQVGAARSETAVPKIPAVADLRSGSDQAGPYLTGRISNASATPESNVPIFAVGVRAGKVVAAGRALVASLPAAGSGQAVTFRVYLVGNPAGASFELTVAPTAP